MKQFRANRGPFGALISAGNREQKARVKAAKRRRSRAALTRADAPVESVLESAASSRRLRWDFFVAPVDDFAGVLGRVQGPLRRSEWSVFRRALDTASALPVMGFYRSDPLSSRAGTHASCIGRIGQSQSENERRDNSEIPHEDGPPACANTRTTLTTRLMEPTGVAVADLATARHTERRLS